MSSNNRNRRGAGGVGMAVGAAFAAALIGLANAPAASADTDLNPFQDLFGDTGINTWTPSADSFLNTIDPTNALATNFDTSVDNFVMGELVTDSSWLTQFGPNVLWGQFDVISQLTDATDPNAFSISGDVLTPVDPTGDFAVGLDYTLFASGLAPTVDPLIMDLWNAQGAPEALLFSAVFWGELLLAPLLSFIGI